MKAEAEEDEEEEEETAPSEFRSPCICTSGLDAEQERHVERLVRQLGGSVAKQWKPAVTHLVAAEKHAGSNAARAALSARGGAPDGRTRCAARTQKYLRAVLTGQWVVRFGWVLSTQRAGFYVDEQRFEFAGDMSTQMANGMGRGAPRIGRLRKLQGKPALLANHQYVLHGPIRELKEKDLHELLGLMGAKPLAELPNTLESFPALASASASRRRSNGRASSGGLLASKVLVFCESHPDEHEAEFRQRCLKHQIRPLKPQWVFDTISYQDPRPDVEAYGFTESVLERAGQVATDRLGH